MQKLSIQNKKLIVTEEMLCTFPENARHDTRTALIKWWINSRVNGGFRLTNQGFKILEKMQYENYVFEAKHISTPKNLLLMDKNIECPYYIDGLGCYKSKLIIFGSKEATIIKLYGDFNRFLRTFN